MNNQLSGFSSCQGQSHSVNNVVESLFEHDQQVFTSDTLFLRCFVECISELLFFYAVNELGSLLFAKLETIFAHFFHVFLRSSLGLLENT